MKFQYKKWESRAMSYSVNSQAIILFRIAIWRTIENCPLIILKIPSLSVLLCNILKRLRQIQEVFVPILIEFSHLFLILATAQQNQLNEMRVQQRLRSAWASTQFDQSLLCTCWVAENPRFLQASSKYSDQTGQMPKLVWIFAERTSHLMILSRCVSCEE